MELVALYGWRLLPFYHFDAEDGSWRYLNQPTELVTSMDALCFNDYCERPIAIDSSTVSLAGQCDKAERELRMEHRTGPMSVLHLREESERLRWFVLPQELSEELATMNEIAATGAL